MGISTRTLMRAKKAIGVHSKKECEIWYWYAPATHTGIVDTVGIADTLGTVGTVGTLASQPTQTTQECQECQEDQWRTCALGGMRPREPRRQGQVVFQGSSFSQPRWER